ncbi:MAG: hypothetical protein LBK42_00165 [Propionibacteriaceae bacterium]|nr:hypothetical protein [Propionibacteriaceae bacterium]
MGALVAVAAVSGAGLTVGQGWRQGLAIESDLAGLVAVGWNPVPLVLVVGVGLVWSLTVIGTVLLLAAAVLSSRLAFVSAATIVLWVIASFQLGLPSWANVADGLVLTMALDDIAATPFALFVPAAGWAAMCLLAAWLVDRRLAQDRPAVVSRLPWLVPPLAVVAMSGLVPAGSAADLLWGSFYGTDGTSPPSLVAYAFLVIVFFGPVYAALVDMERVMDCPLVFQLVRRGGPGRWWWCLVGRAVGRYACYVAGLGLWAVVVASVRARGQFGSRPESSWAWLAWQFGVNGILQGGLYLGVCCLVRWITGRTVGGLAALAVLIGVGLWLSPLGFPVLQNSLGLLEAESPLAVSIRLTAWLSGCATIAAVALSRPGRPLVERNLVP